MITIKLIAIIAAIFYLFSLIASIRAGLRKDPRNKEWPLSLACAVIFTVCCWELSVVLFIVGLVVSFITMVINALMFNHYNGC